MIFYRLWRVVLAATMTCIVLAIWLGIVSRYFLEAPLFWTEEAARIGLVVMTFLGAAELFRRKSGHFAIEAIQNSLPGRLGTAMRWLVFVLVLVLLAALLVGGVLLANGQRFGVSAALGIPSWILYSIIPLSAAMSFAIVALSFRQWTGAPGKDA